MKYSWTKLYSNQNRVFVHFFLDVKNIFIHVKRVKNEHLKYIIRFYYVKIFVKFFKGEFTIGTLDALYVASLNCHWDCLKYKVLTVLTHIYCDELALAFLSHQKRTMWGRGSAHWSWTFYSIPKIRYISTKIERQLNKILITLYSLTKGPSKIAWNMYTWYVYVLADSKFLKNFLYQGGVKSTVSWVFEDLKLKISEGYDQFWSKPSEILNLRSSTTPETVAFTPPWYQTWWNP